VLTRGQQGSRLLAILQVQLPSLAILMSGGIQEVLTV
jgi:hypothetical protein